MSDVVNLADPNAEPTDEQLIGLSKRAFAGVAAKHEAALVRLREEIRELSARALQEIDEPGVASGGK
jgi:hypothetical protein